MVPSYFNQGTANCSEGEREAEELNVKKQRHSYHVETSRSSSWPAVGSKNNKC